MAKECKNSGNTADGLLLKLVCGGQDCSPLWEVIRQCGSAEHICSTGCDYILPHRIASEGNLKDASARLDLFLDKDNPKSPKVENLKIAK
jgi:hypothetical protein